MYNHPDLLWEIVRQRQLELGEEAAQQRRFGRGRHRRRSSRRPVDD